jgi:hypothetical protein
MKDLTHLLLPGHLRKGTVGPRTIPAICCIFVLSDSGAISFVHAGARGPGQTAHEHVSSLCLANRPVLYGLVADLSQIALVAT